MIRSFSVVLILIMLSFTSAKAQQGGECFAVMMTNNPSAGNVGSIMINKCTGQTWALVHTALSNGAYTVRWFPINVEKTEAVVHDQ